MTAITMVYYDTKLASMRVAFPVSMRYLDTVCLCARKDLLLLFYAVNAIMAMPKRFVWRASIMLSY